MRAGKTLLNIRCLSILFHAAISTCWLPLSDALAADIRLFVNSSLRSVVIDGPIEAGDFKKFIEVVKKAQGKAYSVSIFSPGGDFEEAIKIGRAMRALELGSRVPMRNESGRPQCKKDSLFNEPIPNDPSNCTCASACFFIHIGGMHRGGNFLAVHRPYYAKGKFGQLPEAEAKKKFEALQKAAKSYMNEMGVPDHVQADVLGTSSDNALVLDDKTVKTHFWLDLPSRHEWLRNKCSELSPQQESQLQAYRDKLLAKKNLTPEELRELDSLSKKEDVARSCMVTTAESSRVAAYKKYFGATPSDLKEHDFSVWAGSLKYLRKSFDEIKELGQVKEEPSVFGMTQLSLPETEDGLIISVRDSEHELRKVKTVDLFKRSTSKAFEERVIKELERAWGKPKSVKVTDKRREHTWDKEKDGFWATLRQNPGQKEPYLTLEVGAFWDHPK